MSDIFKYNFNNINYHFDFLPTKTAPEIRPNIMEDPHAQRT
jgi:hypothetical protein